MSALRRHPRDSSFSARTLSGVPFSRRQSKIGIVVEMDIKAILARAVEIPRQRGKRAFEIRRAACRVIPRIANLVAGPKDRMPADCDSSTSCRRATCRS